eukprot:TRINITY_DN3082_c0_g1_i1.p1 TRINITY_DN3082_c0_g1~~TRINITY_DN3082_c0_g1_i1.p1  ORF type:complete len:551 (-),score=84.44 TRINITY_DN3082_c0_g1_i1:18-1670(-)
MNTILLNIYTHTYPYTYTHHTYHMTRRYKTDHKKHWHPYFPNGKVDTHITVFNSLSNQKNMFQIESVDKPIKWYTCGPTVYDDAHLGHARNYVTLQIMIDILSKYFGYHIDHLMGITDIDDKIVKRAKERQMDVKVLADYYESSFFTDLEKLGFRKPVKFARVTEHIPEIIQFIEGIIENDLAYISNGSVYFDSRKFGNRNGKLRSIETNKEGEFAHEKKSPLDFALWKKNMNENEIGWDNPFSSDKGRPGWHIECSAMSTKYLGEHFDVHSGGIDLLFPHHNNEIAQCDARFGYGEYQEDTPQWVNYFLHVGHLYIDGLKMSKSLKNFLTVDQFLQEYSANQFKWFCLMSPWHTNVTYTSDRMNDAKQIESRFTEFFGKIDKVINNISTVEGVERKISARDDEMFLFFGESKVTLRKNLRDNLDTSLAVRTLLNLISKTNSYLDPGLDATNCSEYPLRSLLIEIKDYITSILDIFGIKLAHNNSNASEQPDQLVHAEELATIRNNIRQNLNPPDKKALFMELDRIRDDVIPKYGYSLKDTKTDYLLIKN